MNIVANNKPVVDTRKKDIIHKAMAEEGGYADNPKFLDQPTNYGITQPTLDKYNADHPDFNFPKNVKDIAYDQAKQIYKEDFLEKRRIDEIKNLRVSHAVFDMGGYEQFQ